VKVIGILYWAILLFQQMLVDIKNVVDDNFVFQQHDSSSTAVERN